MGSVAFTLLLLLVLPLLYSHQVSKTNSGLNFILFSLMRTGKWYTWYKYNCKSRWTVPYPFSFYSLMLIELRRKTTGLYPFPFHSPSSLFFSLFKKSVFVGTGRLVWHAGLGKKKKGGTRIVVIATLGKNFSPRSLHIKKNLLRPLLSFVEKSRSKAEKRKRHYSHYVKLIRNVSTLACEKKNSTLQTVFITFLHFSIFFVLW